MNNETIDLIVTGKAFKELNELVVGLQAADKEFLKLSTTVNSFSKDGFKLKGPKEFVTHTKKANEVAGILTETIKQQTQAEKNLVTALVKKEQTTNANNKAIAKQRFESQQIAKANKEEAILSSTLSTEYQKLNVELNKMVRRYQDLAAKKVRIGKLTRKEAAEFKKLGVQVRRTDIALKGIDAQVGRNFRNVGNYAGALRGLGFSLRSLMSAFGITSGVFIFAAAVRDAFKRVRDFDKSMQNLAGVMRTTRSDVKDLEDAIVGVASVTVRTSNEVAKLAETLATLGKSKDEIKDLLKPIIDLSLGLDAPADEAGEFLVQMLNAFGKSTDSAAEFADTIATIRTSTTLDFQRMRVGFQYMAPISRILGNDLAYTGSVVGILADNGLKAEQASRLLGTAQIKLAVKGKTLNEALIEINEAQSAGASNSEIAVIAYKLFGIQAAKVGAILAFNTDAIEINAQAIRDNGGALEDLTNEQLKSLDARLKILDSTYEGFILSLESGNSVIGKTVKFFIDALTLSIKQLQFASDNAAIAFNGVLSILSLNPILWSKTKDQVDDLGNSLGETTKELMKQDAAFRELNNGAMRPFTKTQQDIIDNQKEINDIFGGGFVGSTTGEVQKTIKDYRDSIKALKDEIEDLGDGDRNLIKLKQDEIKLLQEKINKLLGVTKKIKENKKALEGSIKAFEETISKLEGLRGATALTEKQYSDFTTQIDQAKASLSRLKDELEGVEILELSTLTSGGLDFGTDNGVPDGYLDPEIELMRERLLVEKETNARVLELRENFYNDLGNLAQASINAIFDSQIQKYQDDIDANSEYYAALLDNEKLTEGQREALEAERDAKNIELEKKKREEEKKAFLIGQAFAVAQIALDLAKTIGAINLAAAEIDALTPFLFGAGGASYRAANLPLAIGIAAAQTATVVAQTIPQFKEGKKASDNYEGKMIWGEVQPEVKVSRLGEIEVATKPTLGHTKKGDTIYPSVSAFQNDVMNQAVILNTISQGEKITGAMMQGNMVADFAKALKQQKQPNITNNIKSIDYNKLAKAVKLNDYANRA